MCRSVPLPAMHHSDLVCVKRVSFKGRGVFARRAIPKGAIIERVPVIIIALKDIMGGLDASVLKRYVFIRSKSTVAIALGFGSLYNHCYTPNARYDDAPGPALVFTALRRIAPGEEITINYNGDPRDRSSVGFDVR